MKLIMGRCGWRSQARFWLAVCILNWALGSTAQFVAYNDQVAGPGTHSNATAYSILAAPDYAWRAGGLLRNITDGKPVQAVLTISNAGAVASPFGGYFCSASPPTPAAAVFQGFVDISTGQLEVSGSNFVAHVFSGLNRNYLYSFKGTAIRGYFAHTNRWSLFEIVGARSFVSAHSSNALTSAQVTSLTPSQVAINTGVNTYTPECEPAGFIKAACNAEIAFWDKIRPGTDGTFTVISRQYTGPVPGGSSGGTAGYALSAVRLEEFAFGILSQPQSLIVATGETARFSVEVFGDPPLGYSWGSYAPVKHFNPTNEVCEVTNTTFWCAGSYYVVVTNLQHVAMSLFANLTVGSYPVGITNQPRSQSVKEGQPATLAVGVWGTMPYWFQWYHDGRIVPGATNPTCSILQASPADGGDYFVVASNRLNSTVSSNAALAVSPTFVPSVPLIAFTNQWRYNPSGLDAGSSWKERDFDDSSWQSGPGIFSSEKFARQPVGAVLSLQNDLGNYVLTYYFRTHFFNPLSSTNILLVTSNVLTDGAVYYLNGAEAGRLRMPTGPIGYLTTAQGCYNMSDYTYVVASLDARALVPGDNVLAVEVHRCYSTSPYVQLGLAMDALPQTGEPVRIVAQPEDATVNEGAPVVLRAPAWGTPPVSLQWFKDGMAVSGGTSDTLLIPDPHSLDSGSYCLWASNSLNFVVSSNATLIVITDTNPPTILSARAYNLSTVLVTFSEPVDPATAANAQNYAFDRSLVVSNIQILNATNVLLTTSTRDPQYAYGLTASGIWDTATVPNVMPQTGWTEVRVDESFFNPGVLQRIRTVFIILMENECWSRIQGSSYCPYINHSLLPMASYALNYRTPSGDLHPSEPSYIWLEAGTNFGIMDNNDPFYNHLTSTNHLARLLDAAGISWRSYQEDISGTECPVSGRNLYVPRHNPFVFFDDMIADETYCIRHNRPYTELAADLANNAVARYNFITPNLTNDMHTLSPGSPSETKQGDDWLARELPKILNSATYSNNGAIFITWEENDPMGMIVLSPLAKGSGYSNTVAYTHSSTLRTMQDIFGVPPYLGDAANAVSLTDLFKNLTVSAGPLLPGGQQTLVLSNLAPGALHYVQASGDLLNWTTISTNLSTSDTLTFTASGTDSFLRRFYRVIEVP